MLKNINVGKFILTQEGLALQSDLYLKEKYPLIKTEIFLLSDNSFVIKPSFNPFNNFLEFQKYFDDSVRAITANVKLIEANPNNFVKLINPIYSSRFLKTNSIASYFKSHYALCINRLIVYLNYTLILIKKNSIQQISIPMRSPYLNEILNMNRVQFYNLILSNFPSLEDLKMGDLSNDFSYNLQCKIDKNVNKIKFEKDLRAFLDNLKTMKHLKYNISFSEDDLFFSEKLQELDVMTLYPYQIIKKYTNSDLRYIKYDDEYWFGNAQKIYSGEISKKDIYKKFGIKNSKTKIYADCSVFNTIDLRYFLAMYDEIYLVPPINNEFSKKFFSDNKTSEDDLFEMIKRDRIKLVIRQPETKLDTKFLMRVYEQNKNAILSKRAVHAIVASNLVDLNQNYLFYQKSILESELFKDVGKLYKLARDNKNEFQKIKKIINFLSLPQQMLLSHARTSHSNSRIYTGIEDSVNDLFSKFEKDKKDAYKFEVIMNNENIQIANSLNAFLAPRILFDAIGGIRYNTSNVDSLIGLHLLELNQFHINNFDNSIFKMTSEEIDIKNKTTNHNLSEIPIFCAINNTRGNPKLSEFDDRLPKFTKKSFNKLLINLIEADNRDEVINEHRKEMNQIMDRDIKFKSIGCQFSLSLLSNLLSFPIKKILNGFDETLKQFEIRNNKNSAQTLAKIIHCIHLKP